MGPTIALKGAGDSGLILGCKHRMLTEPRTDSLLPTRQSLLSRLRDCEDQEGWREFFDTYWRLIYNVARQAGLDEATAHDMVQNTFIYLARRMPKFRYDPARGSFKSWLRRVTRSRISVFRRRRDSKEPPLPTLPMEDDANVWESIPDPAGDALDEVWQLEASRAQARREFDAGVSGPASGWKAVQSGTGPIAEGNRVRGVGRLNR